MNEISDFEKLQYSKNEIHNEFNILATRTSILVTCQSFLVVPFALLQTGASYPIVAVYAYIIALIGILTSIIIIQPLHASHIHIDHWMLKQRKILEKTPELDFFATDRDKLPGASENFKNDPLHKNSLAFSIYGPIAFIVFWIFMCIWSTIRLIKKF